MRSRPPGKLPPNFDVASEARRSPGPQVVLSPSPPADERPLPSPFATTPQQPSFPPQSGVGNNPWHALAAMSGAPTPGLEGPSSLPRGSPMLGRPFERLNIGGSWSGNNLTLSDAMSSPADSPPPATRHGVVPGGAIAAGYRPPTSPLNVSGLAQRRAMAAGSLKPSPSITSSPLSSATARAGRESTSGSSSPVGSSMGGTSKLRSLSVKDANAKVNSRDTLILDIRPPSSFHKSHLPDALSIPVPSTLLRRPAFDTQKLLGMLGVATRETFSKWRDFKDIIIVDQESTSASDSAVLLGLSSKFDREGYEGGLWFINGGHSAMEADGGVELVVGDGELEGTPAAADEDMAPLGIGRLSRVAFQQASTQNAEGSSRSKLSKRRAFKLGIHASLSNSEQQGSQASRHRLQPANPFFDNIRQNLELSYGGITERIPLSLPENVTRRANDLPDFLRDLVTMPDKDSQNLLADQFYRIERGEQKRLQNVMEVLSKGGSNGTETRTSFSDQSVRTADEIEQLMKEKDSNGYYPFSITAGVERGAKNRYKNIWPYDFSRVRLGTPCDDDSDYINASFVQPLGTARRYIATQGPLDATYQDFWTLIWEQNVRVIVMLTQQYEGGLLKCGKYWQAQQYGHIHLRLETQVGVDDNPPHDPTTGFDFGPAALPPGSKTPGESVNIQRVFTVWHDKHPDEPPRKVTQIQCINWPDFDVPDAPEILLDLMHDVDVAVEETGISGCRDDRCLFPPVLVHCSAGVGRTGSFILVDAITDGLRREYRLKRQRQRNAAIPRDSFPGLVPIPQETAEETAPPAPPKQRTVSFATAEPAPTVLPQQEVAVASPSAMDVDRLPPADSVPDPLPSSEPGTGATTPEYEPVPITQSHVQHRTPVPLSSMDEPILEVLQAMRVQRMSLVQSLRQYLFVHRAIIVHYLAMVDEESRRPDSSLTTGTEHTSSVDSTNRSASTGATSTSGGGSFDDEGSFKRKSSTTDLQPQMDVRVQLHSDTVEGLRSSERDGSVHLAKRASFKKRRAANGEDGKGKSVPGSATPSPSIAGPSPSISATSPKPILRRGKS